MTKTSWWGYLLSIAGLALCGGAILLMAGGEDEAITRYLALTEGAGQVIEAGADKVDPNNEGRLIHIADYATTDETLSDPIFGVSIQGLVLTRQVLMYQWDERSRSNDGKTEYYMSKVWSDTVIDASKFHEPYHRERYKNPTQMPYPSANFPARDAWLGEFKVPPDVLLEIEDLQDLGVNSAMLPDTLQEQIKVDEGAFYIGPDPGEPRIGDARVIFEQLPQTSLSVAARQVNNELQPFQTGNGQTILLVKTGSHKAEDLFGGAQRGSAWQAWPTRLGGFFMMAGGLFLLVLLFTPLREWLRKRKGYVTFLTPIMGGFTVLLLLIAAKWLGHWPMFGGIMLAVGLIFLGILGYLLSRGRHSAVRS